MLEDSLSVWASDTREGIEEDFEVGVRLEKLLDEREVEDIFQHLSVVGARIDDLDLEGTICLCANCVDVNIWDIGDLVGSKFLGCFEDLVCDGFWSWSSVCEIVFDSEIILWS